MRLEQEELGIKENNDANLQRHRTFKKVVKKWKNWIQVSEHNFEQKIAFFERDFALLQQKIQELTQRSDELNTVLSNQHSVFNEFTNAEKLDQNLISLRLLGINRQLSAKKSPKKSFPHRHQVSKIRLESLEKKPNEKFPRVTKEENVRVKQSQSSQKPVKLNSPTKKKLNQAKDKMKFMAQLKKSSGKKKEEAEEGERMQDSLDSILKPEIKKELLNLDAVAFQDK